MSNPLPCPLLRCKRVESCLSQEGGDLPGADSAGAGDAHQEHLPSVPPTFLKDASPPGAPQGHRSGGDAAHGGAAGPRQHQDG